MPQDCLLELLQLLARLQAELLRERAAGLAIPGHRQDSPDAGVYDALQGAVVDRVVAVPESLAR
jgi:hypothetical protein